MLLQEIAAISINPTEQYLRDMPKFFKKYGNNLCFSFQNQAKMFPTHLESNPMMGTPTGMYGWLIREPMDWVDPPEGDGGFSERPYIFAFALKPSQTHRIMEFVDERELYKKIHDKTLKEQTEGEHVDPNLLTKNLLQEGIGAVRVNGSYWFEGPQAVALTPECMETLGHYKNLSGDWYGDIWDIYSKHGQDWAKANKEIRGMSPEQILKIGGGK